MELGYKPPADFELDSLQPLVNLSLTGSEELWLIQWPLNQSPEINGKEFKVKLDEHGLLGSLEDSSGKEFDVVSFASEDVGSTVIVPSGAESEIVGKISRRVSLVRYPEPGEVIETVTSKTQQRFSGALTSSSNQFSTPTRNTHSALRHSASARSSKNRSALSGFTEPPKSSKRKHSESIGRSNPSGSSGKSHRSTTTVSGSSDRAEKSKKKKKSQE